MHDEEGGTVGGAEPGVAVVREGAHVVEEMAAVGEDGGDGFGAPCIAVSYTHLTLPTTPYV